MRLALVQLNTTVGDFDGNKALILDAYAKAVAQGADIVLTPELSEEERMVRDTARSYATDALLPRVTCLLYTSPSPRD